MAPQRLIAIRHRVHLAEIVVVTERLTIVATSYHRGWNNPLSAEELERYARENSEAQRHLMLGRIRNKERNMMNRLERRRAAIRLKWKQTGKAALVCAGLLIAVPIVMVAIVVSWNLLWRVML